MSILATLFVCSLTTGRGYTKEVLEALDANALQEFTSMEGRCITPASAQTPDIEAEDVFRRSAAIWEIVVQNWDYPANRKGQGYRSDDISRVAEALERAYMCHPGLERRHYLDRAGRMVMDRIDQIVTEEKRQLSEPDDERLSKARERVLVLMRGMVRPEPPPPCVSRRCEPALDAPSGPSPAASPRGYRGKYMDLFSLRVEIGLGVGTSLVESTSTTSTSNVRDVFLFGVAPGVRFLVGAHKRHVLATGFRWNLLAFHGDEDHLVHQMAARVEYGLRLHKRWLSLHAAFEPGLQARIGGAQISGSGAICTGNEAFCVRFGGYSGLPGGDPGLNGMFLSAGIDVFRVADNILRRAER